MNVFTCISYKGIGRAWIVKHTETLHKENNLTTLLERFVKKEAVGITDLSKRKSVIAAQLMKQEDNIDGVIALGDEDFSKHRSNVKNSERPVVLFYTGDIKLLQPENKNIVVSGSLELDASTEHCKRSFINRIKDAGVTVISGLAYDYDALTHEQTVTCNGKTIAILPSPLHNILPNGNNDLAMNIVKSKGLLMSEYLYDTFSKLGFTARYNIIQAVMYDANINNSKYDLNRQLINEQPDITIIEQTNNMNALDNLLEQLLKQDNQNIQHSLF